MLYIEKIIKVNSMYHLVMVKIVLFVNNNGLLICTIILINKVFKYSIMILLIYRLTLVVSYFFIIHGYSAIEIYLRGGKWFDGDDFTSTAEWSIEHNELVA